jgi:hypothetical protein
MCAAASQRKSALVVVGSAVVLLKVLDPLLTSTGHEIGHTDTLPGEECLRRHELEPEGVRHGTGAGVGIRVTVAHRELLYMPFVVSSMTSPESISHINRYGVSREKKRERERKRYRYNVEVVERAQETRVRGEGGGASGRRRRV